MRRSFYLRRTSHFGEEYRIRKLEKVVGRFLLLPTKQAVSGLRHGEERDEDREDNDAEDSTEDDHGHIVLGR